MEGVVKCVIPPYREQAPKLLSKSPGTGRAVHKLSGSSYLEHLVISFLSHLAPPRESYWTNIFVPEFINGMINWRSIFLFHWWFWKIIYYFKSILLYIIIVYDAVFHKDIIYIYICGDTKGHMNNIYMLAWYSWVMW
jgi:hypothetical protein